MAQSNDTSPPPGNETKRTRPERLAQNPWMTISERAAVYVLVAGMGFVVYVMQDLNEKIADPSQGLIAKVQEVRTIQNEAIVPVIRNLERDVATITHNLIERPRFDQDDGRRLDDKHTLAEKEHSARHRKDMEGLAERIRRLERGDHAPHNP